MEVSRRRRGVFLHAARDDLQCSIGKRSLQLQGFVRGSCHPDLDLFGRGQDHWHGLRMDGEDFGIRIRRQESIEVVGGLAFLDLPDRGPFGPNAREAGEGTALVDANQMSPPSALLNSLKELKGTTQRCSGPSHRVQCLLFTLRMLVVPESGSIRSSSLKSMVLSLARSFSARFFVASMSAFDDDGMPQRASASSRPPAPVRIMGAL